MTDPRYAIGQVKLKGQLTTAERQQAFAALAALPDQVYNAVRGLKYQRDLSNLVVGAMPGFFLQSIGDIAAMTIVLCSRLRLSVLGGRKRTAKVVR